MSKMEEKVYRQGWLNKDKKKNLKKGNTLHNQSALQGNLAKLAKTIYLQEILLVFNMKNGKT